MSYISTSKTLLFKDELNQKDNLGNRVALRGDLTMMDDGGRVVFRNKPNLILLRGRVHAMERLFKDIPPASAVNTGSTRTGSGVINPYYHGTSPNSFSRSIWGFCIGRGAADGSAGDSVDTENRRLSYQIPFRVIVPGSGVDGTTESATTSPPNTGNVRGKYGGVISEAFVGAHARTASELASVRFDSPYSSSTRLPYFYKKFTTATGGNEGWAIGSETYLEMEMEITKFDCRVPPKSGITYTDNLHLFNEIGLVIAVGSTADSNAPITLSNVELFTRLSFDNEPLHNDKSLTMKYRIYA